MNLCRYSKSVSYTCPSIYRPVALLFCKSRNSCMCFDLTIVVGTEESGISPRKAEHSLREVSTVEFLGFYNCRYDASLNDVLFEAYYTHCSYSLDLTNAIKYVLVETGLCEGAREHWWTAIHCRRMLGVRYLSVGPYSRAYYRSLHGLPDLYRAL